jgi:hypothetical protein
MSSILVRRTGGMFSFSDDPCRFFAAEGWASVIFSVCAEKRRLLLLLDRRGTCGAAGGGDVAALAGAAAFSSGCSASWVGLRRLFKKPNSGIT